MQPTDKVFELKLNTSGTLLSKLMQILLSMYTLNVKHAELQITLLVTVTTDFISKTPL